VSDVALSPQGAVAGLGPGATDTRADTVAFPSPLAPGLYWLGVCVDWASGSTPADAVLEANETNNCRTSSSQVQVSAGPVGITT
jgi:hypothetical protein